MKCGPENQTSTATGAGAGATGWGQKLSDLTAIRDLPLSPDVAGLIANFTTTQWSAVQSEALSVLEQTMRGQVRQDELEGLRQSIPARVSVDLNEAQVQVVSALVMPLIVSNSFYNEVATQAERDAARAAVAPVSRQFVRGQTVVARGQVIKEVDVEALEAFGLMQPELRWQETVSSGLIALVVCILLLVYVQRAVPALNLSPKSALLLGLLVSFYLLAAKFMVPGHTLLPYLLPAAALAMIVTLLASVNFAIVVSVVLAVLAWRSPRINAVSMQVAQELERVSWPNLRETRASTVAVVVFTFVAAFLLGIFDLVWSRLSSLVY